VTTNEELEATYTVRYFVDSPPIPPQNDKLPQMDYTQAINVATGWIKDDCQIDIFDGSLPIFRISQRGVEFEKFAPLHAHFVQHLKIKIALDKAWEEQIRKSFQI
jgi:hypothetical protein